MTHKDLLFTNRQSYIVLGYGFVECGAGAIIGAGMIGGLGTPIVVIALVGLLSILFGIILVAIRPKEASE